MVCWDYSYALKYAPKSLKSVRDIVLAAVTDDGPAMEQSIESRLKYAAKSLWSDTESLFLLSVRYTLSVY